MRCHWAENCPTEVSFIGQKLVRISTLLCSDRGWGPLEKVLSWHTWNEIFKRAAAMAVTYLFSCSWFSWRISEWHTHPWPSDLSNKHLKHKSFSPAQLSGRRKLREFSFFFFSIFFVNLCNSGITCENMGNFEDQIAPIKPEI